MSRTADSGGTAMLNTIKTRSLALLLICLHVAAVSASGRPLIECADGTPCTDVVQSAPAVEAHGCCLPAPCDESPPAPLDTRCVITSTPAVSFVLPASIPDLTALPPVPFASPAGLIPSRNPFATAPREISIPPHTIPLDQGQGPRAPPSHTHPA